jgi:hypothetical protein
MASARFGQLADGERTGTLTGTWGSGTVVQLLSQMSNQLGTLSRTVEQSTDRANALYDRGSKRLAKMPELVSSRAPISPRRDAFGNEATVLLGDGGAEVEVQPSLRQDAHLPAMVMPISAICSGPGLRVDRPAPFVQRKERPCRHKGNHSQGLSICRIGSGRIGSDS